MKQITRWPAFWIGFICGLYLFIGYSVLDNFLSDPGETREIEILFEDPPESWFTIPNTPTTPIPPIIFLGGK